MAAMLAMARQEVLVLVPTWPAPLRDFLRRRAVPRSRLVVSRLCRNRPALRPSQTEVRIGGDPSTFLLVVDRRTALVRRNGPDQCGGATPHTSRNTLDAGPTVVHPAEIDRLVATFAHHWDRSAPVAPDQTRPMTELQVRILRQLATGMTDQAAANALKISSRTVQRQVRDAMEQLGARSRLELGICLAATDLV